MSSNTSTLVNESALIIAYLIMYRKILDALTILSTILVLGILGGSFVTYKYVTSEQFKAKMMEQVMGKVSGLMPKVLDKGLPDMTGTSVPDKNWTVPGVPKL